MTAADETYPGRRFGLPREGVGAVAPMGVRVGAFALDLAVSFLVALAFTRPALPQNWSLLVWAVLTVVSVGLFGSSPGQVALGIRVAPVGGAALVGLWAVPRTALVFVVVPPLLTDQDGRGLHDRLCRTVVVRSR
ncbi:RDD family protein [Nakamurella endophytica]|uniref:RDD family protein n=1 Tax=Nakamurella endophytica TaxID=1748367 RepID=A0A917T220_9ACTN|nr:RDD family protein [Nakamurella endophytica]GGM06441.1 RDD family protein [Nakamurella endophytica]